MKTTKQKALVAGLALVCVCLLATSFVIAQSGAKRTGSGTAVNSAEPPLISPEELVNILNSPKATKPLILNVGPRTLYVQAHITGAEFIGAGSEPAGIQALRNRVKSLPKNKFIVIYCGCCPWSHCPNVHPAYNELRAMGFTNAKVLYIANNIGADWVYKGYPTAKGE